MWRHCFSYITIHNPTWPDYIAAFYFLCHWEGEKGFFPVQIPQLHVFTHEATVLVLPLCYSRYTLRIYEQSYKMTESKESFVSEVYDVNWKVHATVGKHIMFCLLSLLNYLDSVKTSVVFKLPLFSTPNAKENKCMWDYLIVVWPVER